MHANPKTSSADRTGYYVEFTNARPLKIGDLGHFTAHIRYLRIIDEIFCCRFHLPAPLPAPSERNRQSSGLAEA